MGPFFPTVGPNPASNPEAGRQKWRREEEIRNGGVEVNELLTGDRFPLTPRMNEELLAGWAKPSWILSIASRSFRMLPDGVSYLPDAIEPAL